MARATVERWWTRVKRHWRPLRTRDAFENAGLMCWVVYLVMMLGLWISFQSGLVLRAMQGRSADVIGAWAIGTMLLRMMLPLLAMALIGVGWWRYRRRLRRAKFCLCPKCLYDLRGVRTAERCPECGFVFEPGEVARTWRERLPNRRRQRDRNVN